MDKIVFSYLRTYSFDLIKINRLVVSSFIYSNKITVSKNKLIKSLIIGKSDDDYADLLKFINLTKVISLENLVEIFEFVISPEDKIVTGAVYTPSFIRDYILEYCFSKKILIGSLTICDPACGCAGFLSSAAKKLKKLTQLSYKEIFKNNLFGLDIQDFSVQRSELLLTLLAIYEKEDDEEFEFNLYIGNALEFHWPNVINDYKGFDLVVGNPPYVCSRNISAESKELLKNWSVCSTGHPDLYIPFFEIGITNLKEGGFLGFITMNTFYKSVNGRALRKYFHNLNIDFTIIDFGGNQIFESKSTYTCLCLIQVRPCESIRYARLDNVCSLLDNTFTLDSILYSSLDYHNGWNLKEAEIIKKIESTGVSLGERFISRNGIATLKNSIYIFNPIQEDDAYYYIMSDKIYPVEKGICIEVINSNKLTNGCTVDQLKEKLIFPYRYDCDGHAKLVEEEILRSSYPCAYIYLESKKDILSNRDKGLGKYENWYAYGRKQSLSILKNKLFFPHIAISTPDFIINSDESLLFYNGLAIVSESVRDLLFIKKIMSSRLFWFYIKNSSKPYGSGYYSLSKNYIKNFGIYNFTEVDIDYMLLEEDEALFNCFVENKYSINLEGL